MHINDNTIIDSNYAPSIYPQLLASKHGYQQVMWLWGTNHQICEVGTMNIFFFLKQKDGTKELVTPSLDGTILPGVTRDSILHLAREWNEFQVSERTITMDEVLEALHEKRLIEAFGAGTAAIVSPVEGIHFENKEHKVPLDRDDPNAKAGKLAVRIMKTIMGIQYGKIDHPWSMVISPPQKK